MNTIVPFLWNWESAASGETPTPTQVMGRYSVERVAGRYAVEQVPGRYEVEQIKGRF